MKIDSPQILTPGITGSIFISNLSNNPTGYFLSIDDTTGQVFKASGGASGTNGSSGSSGAAGSSGSSGTDGATGSSGESGSAGSSGSSGTDGATGSSGESGTSGTSGTSGSSGTSGESGTSGSSGSSGSSGTSGSSGVSGISSGQIYYFNQSVSTGIGSYKQLSTTPLATPQVEISLSLGGSTSNNLISSFITDQLGFAVIPCGTLSQIGVKA